jgi:hypothetical protein
VVTDVWTARDWVAAVEISPAICTFRTGGCAVRQRDWLRRGMWPGNVCERHVAWQCMAWHIPHPSRPCCARLAASHFPIGRFPQPRSLAGHMHPWGRALMAETGGADCVRVLLAAQAEITLTITATYATYILADVYLKVSAVLACVALGTFLAAKGKHLISRDVQHPFHVVWWVLSSPGAGTLSTWCGGFYLALVQAPLPRHVVGGQQLFWAVPELCGF